MMNQANNMRRAAEIGLLQIAIVLLAACGSSASPQAGDQTSAQPASGNALPGPVVITGAIDKTYTPEEVSAMEIADDVSIGLVEEFPCGVSIQFPMDIQPGSYPMGDPIKQLGEVVVFGDYNTPTCQDGGSLSDTFRSMEGTLTLTSTGDKFSGTFDFTAAKMNDQSKTILVSGSFSNVPFP